MNLKPLFNRVVIEVEIPEEVTAGGIALPETAIKKASQNIGKVVAVGPGMWRNPFDGEMVPLQVKVGQTVLFSPATGLPFKLGKKDYLIFDESSILAILGY